jgi:hypothetical protein
MRSPRFLLSVAGMAAGLLGSSAVQAAQTVATETGPLPAAALILPSDVSFVLGFDIKRLVASPLYERMSNAGGMKPSTLNELQKTTGIVPERDLKSFVMAGNTSGDAAMLVFGKFDLALVGAALESDGKATKTTVGGIPVYVAPGPKGKDQMSLALVSTEMLAIGSPARVEAMLAARAAKAQPFLAGGKVAAAARSLGSLGATSTFWMVGDGSLAKNVPGGPSGMPMPALENLIMTGDFAPDFQVNITGQTSEASGATELANMLRGLIGLAAMQGGQKPELQALVSGLKVTSEGSKVTLSARIAYEVLDKLMPSAPKPPSGASAPVTLPEPR